MSDALIERGLSVVSIKRRPMSPGDPNFMIFAQSLIITAHSMKGRMSDDDISKSIAGFLGTLENGKGMTLYCLVDSGGIVVGTCMVGELVKPKRVLDLKMFSIVDSHRGQGLGKAFFSVVKKRSKWPSFSLNSLVDSTGFWKSLGFNKLMTADDGTDLMQLNVKSNAHHPIYETCIDLSALSEIRELVSRLKVVS